MKHEPISPAEARAALDAMDDARARVAELGLCPPWRHAAFGAVMGMVILGQGVHAPWMWLLYGAGVAGAVTIAIHDRRKYGVFVNGYRRGRTRIVALAMVAAMLLVMGLEVWLRESGAALAVRVAVAVAAAAGATWSSVIWNRVFRREMQEAIS